MKPLGHWRREASTLVSGGYRLAYWTADAGDETKPWLLLLHGYPTSSWDWTFIWNALRRHFRLAALDMLGFGLSDKPRDIKYSIFQQADFQEALLEHLGVGEAHILAHDYGDTVAQELLARQNERALSFSLKSAVFLNGGLFPEQHRARPVQKFGLTPFGFILGMMMSREKLRSAFDKLYGPETKAGDDEIDAHWAMIEERRGARILHKLLNYVPERQTYRDRWVGALENATIALRLIDGGADPVSGAHLFQHYKKIVPNADAVLLEKIGHYPHTEAPDAVVDAFFDFHQTIMTIAR
ncbi:MAG: alpha/beta hydrolase [Parvularculaceae bacterium]|nr:alpha/beta hydrolase [Parvularculaceae bacterium]